MIIKNVAVFTNDPENYFIPRGFVEIRGRVIRNVGRMEEYSASDDEELDEPDAIVTPGMVNVHMSMYNSLCNLIFQNNLNNVTGSNYFVNLIDYFKKHDQKDLGRYSIEMGALQSQLNGITTVFGPVFDSDALSPNIISEIAEKFRIRLVTGPVIFRENLDKVINKWIGATKTDYYYPVVYVTELAEYSEAELKKIANFIASGIEVVLVVFDMHLDDTRCLSLYGEHLIDRLLKAGLMVPNSGIAYAGNMRETDMDVVASKQMFVIKSLRTELFAGTFRSNVADFLGRGMNVCIGSGLLDADLLAEGRGLILSERHFKGFDIKVIDYELKKILFENNYKLAEKFFKRGFGKIKAGYEADLMLAKPRDPFRSVNKELKSLSALIVNLSNNYYVSDVWTSGERVVKSCKLTKITPEDVKEIRERINNLD